MRVTAVAVGTRGDVNPLVELGMEMKKRGHEFRILTHEKFRLLIEGKGVTYLHLDGDADHVMQYMVTDYKTSADFMKGLMKLKKESPAFMEQTMEAVKDSDLIMYGTCGAFARHAAEYYHIPCARYFYSPMDKTDKYSLYSEEYDSPKVGKTYNSLYSGMSMLTKIMMNKWRKSVGLPKWKMSDRYPVMDGRHLLTFYPVSPQLMPPDASWDKDTYVTGYWYHPAEDAAQYEMPDSLREFLAKGEKPVFIAFGKAESEELAELQERTLTAVKMAGIRAIIQADQIKEVEKVNTEKLYFIDAVPYSSIFPYVRGVVHHGGCTTNGLSLLYGCPTLVIPLALDQYFYGRMDNRLGAGPAPLYIRKKLCTTEQIESALLDLVSGQYDEAAREISAKIQRENGVVCAADAIEKYVRG